MPNTLVRRLKNVSLKQSLDYLFITFQSYLIAKIVLRSFTFVNNWESLKYSVDK